MTTQGPNYAGTVANRDNAGAPAWVNPTNAQGVNNGTLATVTDTGGGSDFLEATSFGWTGLSGATITNLKVEAMVDDPADIGDNSLRLDLRDTSHTSYGNRTNGNLSGALAWYTYWNAAPPAGFAAVIIAGTDEYSFMHPAGFANTISIDAIRVTLTYTVAPAATSFLRRAFVPQQTGPRAVRPQQPGDLTAQNFSYREPLPGAHTPFHLTPQMQGPRAFRPQTFYDPRVLVGPVPYEPPLPGAETPYHPTPQLQGPRAFRPQRYDPYTADGTTITNTIVLDGGSSVVASSPTWPNSLYKPANYVPLRYAPMRFKPPRYRKPF